MPAWITPLLAPVWPVASSGARSSTTASRSGRRRVSSRATARPMIPPPTTARSHSAGGAAGISAGLLLRYSAAEEVEIGIDHQTNHLLKACARLPAELHARLARVPDQVLHLRGAEEARVDPDVVVGIDPDMVECDPHELADRVGLACGDHEVVGLVLLEHEPHGLDVVLGIAPIALRVEVAEGKLLLQPELDRCCSVGDLAGDELEAPALRVVDHDAPDAGAEVAALGLEIEDEL